MDLDGMPPRRPCKRQPPSPAMASPTFAESKRTDLRPSPSRIIPHGNQHTAIGSANPGVRIPSKCFVRLHSTHNVKGRCPIEMNLACRGAASTSRTKTQRRALNSFQRSFLSVNSGVASNSRKPTESKNARTSGRAVLQPSPVTIHPSYSPPGSVMNVQTMSPSIAALGEAVNRMTTSPIPASLSKPTPMPPMPPQQQNVPSNHYNPSFLRSPVPSMSSAASISTSMPPPVPNFHYTTPMASSRGPVMNGQKAMKPVKTEQKRKGSKQRKPWSARKAPGKWTKDEDDVLRKAVATYGAKEWKKIAAFLGGTRTSVQCLHRWNKVLKPGLVKGPWTKDEDRVVFDMVMRYGVGNVKWSVIAHQLKGRIGKQCRERWFNHLDPTIIKTPWTVEEDRIMFETQQHLGNRWCEIAKLLPGRTENMVKNRWNSSARKRWFARNGLTPGPTTSARARSGRKKKPAKSTKPVIKIEHTPEKKNRPNISINPALHSPGLFSLLHPSPGVDDFSFPLPSPNTTAQILAQSDIPFQFSPAGTPKSFGDSSLQWEYVVSTVGAGNQHGLMSPCLPSPSSMLVSPTALNRLTALSPSGIHNTLVGDLMNTDLTQLTGFL